MEKLFIVIPAYNEQDNILSCINDWYPIVHNHNDEGGSRLVIIDDGSKDDTYQIIKKESENKPLLLPLAKENSGHGTDDLIGMSVFLLKTK